MIRLADDLQIDLALAAGRRFMTIGKSGFGKTNTLCCIAEGALDGNLPTVIIDPLRQFTYLANQYPVIVAGRIKRAHLDITVKNAEALAKLVLSERVSVIVDTSRYEPEEEMEVVETFLRAFWTGLLMQDEDAVQPFAVIVDELQQFAPEGSYLPTKKILVDMAKRGRHMRLLLATATQRIASITKEMFTQTSLLIAHHLLGSADSDRIAELLNMKSREVTPLMRHLKKGAALVVGDNDLVNDSDYMQVQIIKSNKPDQSTSALLTDVQPRLLDEALMTQLEALAKTEAQPVVIDETTMQIIREKDAQIAALRTELEEACAEIERLQKNIPVQVPIFEPITSTEIDENAAKRLAAAQRRAVDRQRDMYLRVQRRVEKYANRAWKRDLVSYLIANSGDMHSREKLIKCLGIMESTWSRPGTLIELGLVREFKIDGGRQYQFVGAKTFAENYPDLEAAVLVKGLVKV